MDFGALPPEINSGLMYAGPGSGPMTAAAGTWNSLAAELTTTASSYESVISQLNGEEWLGPTSASMAAAVAPYIGWMNATAAAAQQAANQAMASAAAFEAAFAMTVPPPVIAANRAALAALVAANILGQNTPAILANEAIYAEMWAQDAAAMYGYAASSASAGTLQPLSSPAPITNPSGIAAQAAAVSGASTGGLQTELSQVISGLPHAMGSLASPLASASGASGLTGALNSINSFFGIPFVQEIVNNTVYSAGWWIPMSISSGVTFGHAFAAIAPISAVGGAGTLGAGLAGGSVLAGSAGTAGLGGLAGAPVLAGLGSASSIGGLSVPAGWSAATPAEIAPATLAGTGWTAAADEAGAVSTVPAGVGMPVGAAAGRGGFGLGAPRYGFKPIVMPKQVVV
ncbi:PPE family protein [Mycobacterium sp.]|uniref:PPE family protein n=1 Tax=Mycobacterium sp. TaxID=1785 RepID=UPI0031DD02B4